MKIEIKIELNAINTDADPNTVKVYNKMVVADEVIDTNVVTATAAVTDTITDTLHRYSYTNGRNNAAIDAVSGLRG